MTTSRVGARVGMMFSDCDALQWSLIYLRSMTSRLVVDWQARHFHPSITMSAMHDCWLSIWFNREVGPADFCLESQEVRFSLQPAVVSALVSTLHHR